MATVIIFNTIAVLFAWLEDVKVFKYGLKFSLFTVFVFLALRYDFGNDYMAYLASFKEINRYRSIDFTVFVMPKYEIGWVFLNRLFAPFGFFIMTAVLAAFTCFVLYWFIKKYVPLNYYWFAVFFYVFNPANMLILSSAARQAVGVTLFIIAFYYLSKRRHLIYLGLIFIATLFHTSAYFLFPFILLDIVKWRINIFSMIIIFLMFLIPMLLNEIVLEQINIIIDRYFSLYEIYQDRTLLSEIGLGFLLSVIFYIVILYYSKGQSGERLLLFKIALISFIIFSLGFTISMIGRLNFYLNPLLMAVYPIVFIKLKKPLVKFSLIGLLMFFIIYQFYFFFQSDVWRKAFGEYHTIFSSPEFF